MTEKMKEFFVLEINRLTKIAQFLQNTFYLFHKLNLSKYVYFLLSNQSNLVYYRLKEKKLSESLLSSKVI